MLETEKATDRLDLPHVYDAVSQGSRVCICGRVQGSTLHDLTITEQASHSAVLQTEKGT